MLRINHCRIDNFKSCDINKTGKFDQPEKRANVILLYSRAFSYVFFFFIFHLYQITFLFREGHEKMMYSLFCENGYFRNTLFTRIKIADFAKPEEKNASANAECDIKRNTHTSYCSNRVYILKLCIARKIVKAQIIFQYIDIEY